MRLIKKMTAMEPNAIKHSNPSINQTFDWDVDKIIISSKLFKDLLTRIVELERIVEILADDIPHDIKKVN